MWSCYAQDNCCLFNCGILSKLEVNLKVVKYFQLTTSFCKINNFVRKGRVIVCLFKAFQVPCYTTGSSCSHRKYTPVLEKFGQYSISPRFGLKQVAQQYPRFHEHETLPKHSYNTTTTNTQLDLRERLS